MGRVYLANAFALSMLPLEPGGSAEVCVRRVRLGDVMWLVTSAGGVECAIGHKGTAMLLEKLLGAISSLNCERRQIELKPEDTLVAVVLSFRLPEGRVYEFEEMTRLYEEGKISFYVVNIGPC